MEKRDRRYEMLLTASERQALDNLAKKMGMSRAMVVSTLIRQAARRRGIWQ